MKAEINANDYVWVNLLNAGWEVFDKYYADLGVDPETQVEGIYCHGWQQFQLWELANIFGPKLFNGGDQLFSGNRILLTKPSPHDQ